MAYEGRLFIGGEFVDSVSGKAFSTSNPATEEVICEVALAERPDVDRAVSAAMLGAAEWADANPSDRGRILGAMAEAIEAAGAELAHLDSIDAGKPLADCEEDIHASAALFRYFAGLADKANGNTIPVQNDKFCFTRREPYGVVGAITAWNYPLFNACAKLAPILSMGNSCVLKPAEETPLTALTLAQVLQGVQDVPPGLINVVNGPGEVTGQAITEHHDIGKVSFTGSTETGRKVLISAASSNLKSVTLELGGKGPFVIFSDANLDAALNAITFSVFYNQGQTCTAGTRLLVERGIKDRAIEGLLERARRIEVGFPETATTSVGPLASLAQFEKVMGFIDRASSAGIEPVLGGGRPEGMDRGFFVQPTIYVDPDPASDLYRDEIFGPVLVVNSFDTEDEAVLMSNDTAYGLSATIWTADARRIHVLANSIRAGVVWCNTTFSEHPGAPVGGYGTSGFGREFGSAAIEEYTRLKTVWLDLSGDFEAWV